MAKYDYLRWDAESIQELLRRKLLESGLLTDQLYPSSDTKILIDLFAWTFDVLTYMLNNAAADSLFSDTYVYENMNRLVKLLSYNPRGYLTSSAEFKISFNNLIDSSNINNKNAPDNLNIPKFSYIESEKTDKNGNIVRYSFVNDYSLTTYKTSIVTPLKWPILYNGVFKKYPTVFTALGIPNEVFSISFGENVIADHNQFYVYIESINETDGSKSYKEFKRVDNLVLDATYSDEVFEIRLNEYKNYELKFGDGVHGVKLKETDNIHVIYLESNGEDGQIDTGEIIARKLYLNVDGFSNSTDMINMCFGGVSDFKYTYGKAFVINDSITYSCNTYEFTNINSSTMPTGFETVEDIREFAPASFMSGNRLVTESDYHSYILSQFKDRIKDVYVCNNIKYMSEFYAWLKKYNKFNINIRKWYYKFADACDFNNIYLFMKSMNSDGSLLTENDFNLIINSCNRKKTLTSEIIPLNAINVNFIPYVKDPQKNLLDITTLLKSDMNNWPIRIVIIKTPNTYVNNEQIIFNVNKVIVDYFKLENQKLGNIINLNDIYSRIMELGYIQDIKTRYIDPEDSNNIYTINGLSFAYYTETILESSDFEIFTQYMKLLPFQFAKLFMDDLTNFIEVENNNTYNLVNTGF